MSSGGKYVSNHHFLELGVDPQIIVLLVVTFAVAVLKISHTCSRAARGWRMAARSMNSRRTISADVAGQGTNARDNVTNACRNFKSSTQSERLRRTPVSVLEKARSGARLQSLRAAGVTNLEQIRDWGAARFDSLPGVGPKSAYIITDLVQRAVADILKQTVDPPCFPFASESEQLVMNAIYRLRWFEKNLEFLHVEYSSQIRAIDEKLQSLRSRVSFVGWLGSVFLPERMSSLMTDVLSVKKAACQNQELEKLGESLHVLSVELNRLNIWRIEWDVINKAYLEDSKSFDAHLERYFGQILPAAVQNHQAPSEPVEVAIRPDNASPKSVPIPKPPVGESDVLPASSREEARQEEVAMPPGYGLAESMPLPQPLTADRPEIDQIPSLSREEEQQEVACWMPNGRAIQFRNWTIPGGMVYFGSKLNAPLSETEPSLIQPGLAVAPHGDCHLDQTPYWPTYADISPEARAAYLQWLSTGRSDPAAKIGYLFIFFYGLERRVLRVLLPLIARGNTEAAHEVRAIEDEIRRLLWIYGSNHSFRSYAGRFLNRIASDQSNGRFPSKIADLAPPEIRVSPEVNVETWVALGLYAKKQDPLPAQWALAWICSQFGTPARAAQQAGVLEKFKRTFVDLYLASHGPGIIVRSGREPLDFTYRQASPVESGKTGSFAKTGVNKVNPADAWTSKLNSVADECAKRFAEFYDFCGQDPNKGSTPAAAALIPIGAWSRAGFTRLEGLKADIEISRRPQMIEMSTLVKMFAGPIPEPWSLPQATECARTLGLYGMGMEPDPRVTKRVPGESVALFLASGLENQIILSKNFALAEVILRLTAMVITPKEISEEFAETILATLQEGTPLLSSECARLKARLKMYQTDFPVQVSLAWMKLDSIRKNVREKMLDSLVRVLALKGELNAAEVRRLEKITTSMDLDQSAIYSRLHQAKTGSPMGVSAPRTTKPSKADESESGSFIIDYARVQKLQEESEKIAEVLAGVFSDQSSGYPIIETSAAATEIETTLPATLLSLDQPHSSLLRYLLERPEWPRDEIEAACAERGLMVDGALERINEAAFDVYDAPILEGDDPVEVRSELIKECTPA
jgi:hypothetical protein